MGLEEAEQRKEDCEGALEDLWHGRDAVLGEGDAQVLLDGGDEHLVGPENSAGVLEHREEELEGEDLGSELVGPGGWDKTRK